MHTDNVTPPPSPGATESAPPAISFITTVRNGEAHLPAMLASILNQTFKDFEVICVDDGSTDRSVEVIKQHGLQDRRIKCVPTAGVGRSAALNLAVSMARGEYVANIDADDIAHPQRLELQLRVADLLRDTAPNADFAIGAIADVFNTPEPPAGWPSRLHVEDCRFSDVSERLLRGNPICHSSFFCPTTVLKRVNGYNTRLPSQLDYDLYTRMASSGTKLYRIGTALVAKRIHPGQAFQQHRRIKYILSSYRAQRRAIRSLQGGLRHELLAALRLGWACLPESFRAPLRSQIWIFFRK